ncbi:hypothetical protein GCM10010345_90080 [Streptomyces canarius]|uniref:Uncharacterized protein n=1 Tax=Streptomyces canarius TaxID=285453 RepID=A0ABQ3DGD8_9ACTN|nr:hypothetical protein GCM10010345_90080 [Streptomyces canarius]
MRTTRRARAGEQVRGQEQDIGAARVADGTFGNLVGACLGGSVRDHVRGVSQCFVTDRNAVGVIPVCCRKKALKTVG